MVAGMNPERTPRKCPKMPTKKERTKSEAREIVQKATQKRVSFSEKIRVKKEMQEKTC